MTDTLNDPQIIFDQHNQQVGIQLNAGRDIWYQVGESDFFTPSLKQYQAPDFVTSPALDQFADLLYARRLLIFGGDAIVNKDMLARYTAWRLTTQVLPQAAADSRAVGALPIQEWKQSGATDIDIALHEQEKPTIFILPQLRPQHINYDVQEFARIITERQHYVLVIAAQDETWHTGFSAQITVLKHFWQHWRRLPILISRGHELRVATSKRPVFGFVTHQRDQDIIRAMPCLLCY